MMDQAYIKDHIQYIDKLEPDFGRLIARKILEEAANQLGDKKTSTVEVPLAVEVSQNVPMQCVNISVNGQHVGHIGI